MKLLWNDWLCGLNGVVSTLKSLFMMNFMSYSYTNPTLATQILKKIGQLPILPYNP
ncbi:hypothetical protein CRENPOLYSF2_1180015 [Crenothrix polyspora]|uniref:Uncharacterized protein n=1 Tax=Crenothrix polyspora TaxID=360316 RepID=A0A1R4GZU4_9GAMM|nr:hypothetical protein CRENPOLYSF2_1180015 [Crenothrix polyspora]